MKPDYGIWKSGAVKRWHSHIDNDLRESGDTTGWHSQRMALILLMIHPSQPPAHLLACILTHDTPETFTGDVPALVKGGRIGEYLEAYEQEVTKTYGLPIPSRTDKRWIRLCDLLDAILWVADRAPAHLATKPWVECANEAAEIAVELGVYDAASELMGSKL